MKATEFPSLSLRCSDFGELIGIHHAAVVIAVKNATIGEDFFLEFIKVFAVLHSDIGIRAFQFCFLEGGLRSGRTGTGIAEFGDDFILFHAVTS